MNLSRRPRQCPPPKHTSVRRPEDWPPSARASARAPSVFTRPAPTTGRLANSPRAASQFSARPDGSNRAEAGWNALTWNAASHGRRPPTLSPSAGGIPSRGGIHLFASQRCSKTCSHDALQFPSSTRIRESRPTSLVLSGWNPLWKTPPGVRLTLGLCLQKKCSNCPRRKTSRPRASPAWPLPRPVPPPRAGCPAPESAGQTP